MLNKEKLEKIFHTKLTGPEEVSGVEWQSQNSRNSDILFYKIPESQEAEEIFHQRIASSHFAYLVVSRGVENLPANAIVVEDKFWKECQKLVCDELYPMPSIRFIGITGTNGKTTTTDLVLQLGDLIGVKGMSIGTLGVRYPNKTLVDFGLTSPSYIDLRKFLHRFGADREFCVMEVSSHALHQDRYYKIRYDIGAWTSFSQDHLDYHQTMDEYFHSKLLLSESVKDGVLIVPEGQEELKEKIEAAGKKTLTAPLVEAPNLPLFLQSTFNQENLALAYHIVTSLFPSFVAPDISKLIAPEGRFFIRKHNESFIVVDFAHTPDALENICRSIRESFPDKSLRVLFGCGGDRDRKKRPLMTKVVLDHADRVYLTSDNPRFEDPERIIRDMLQGNENKKIDVVVDRKAAVAKAFSELNDGVVLLLAGKGHENTISIKGKKSHYSDIEEVEKFISGQKA